MLTETQRLACQVLLGADLGGRLLTTHNSAKPCPAWFLQPMSTIFLLSGALSGGREMGAMPQWGAVLLVLAGPRVRPLGRPTAKPSVKTAFVCR